MTHIITFTTENTVTAKHFTVEPISEMFLPEPQKRHVPVWYKDIPMTTMQKTIGEMVAAGEKTNRTVRACQPVLDYLTSGYLIRSTSDLLIRNKPATEETNEDRHGLEAIWADQQPFETHSHAQCPVDIAGRKLTYIKMLNPWNIKTPVGYSCAFYQPFFSMENRFTLMPAFVDTDTYTRRVNFPGWINGTEDHKIPAGTPLMTVFPYKRDAWKMEVVEAPTNEPDIFLRFWGGAYKKLFWHKKEFK